MLVLCFFFFFNDPATTEIYTLSLHDALPISLQADHRAVRQERVEQRAMAADRVHAQNHREARRALAPHEREPPRLGLRRGDRKSTRLNSSHQIISYAVFCLKKKKHITHTRTI